jgi:hypothetical protein
MAQGRDDERGVREELGAFADHNVLVSGGTIPAGFEQAQGSGSEPRRGIDGGGAGAVGGVKGPGGEFPGRDLGAGFLDGCEGRAGARVGGESAGVRD